MKKYITLLILVLLLSDIVDVQAISKQDAESIIARIAVQRACQIVDSIQQDTAAAGVAILIGTGIGFKAAEYKINFKKIDRELHVDTKQFLERERSITVSLKEMLQIAKSERQMSAEETKNCNEGLILCDTNIAHCDTGIAECQKNIEKCDLSLTSQAQQKLKKSWACRGGAIVAMLCLLEAIRGIPGSN